MTVTNRERPRIGDRGFGSKDLGAPRMSVVLPVYNGASFLASAVQSILAQTFADLELLVIDDGSTDASGTIAASFGDPRVRVLRNDRNEGIVASLNRGLAEARGAYVCRMDADDVSLPERLERQAAALDAEPALALLGTGTVLIDSAGREIGREVFPSSAEAIRREIFRRNPFAHSTVALRRSAVAACGPYSNVFPHNEDYDLWLRITARFDAGNLPEPLVKRRIHAASVSAVHGRALRANRARLLLHAARHYYRRPILAIFAVRALAAYALDAAGLRRGKRAPQLAG